MRSRPYQHKQFPAGINVQISPDILNLHSASPIAGKTGITTRGHYYIIEGWWSKLDPIPQQIDKVPVNIEGTVYFVEPEFVSKT